MHKYDYSFIKTSLITSEIFSLSNIITDLKEKTNNVKIKDKPLFDSLEKIATRDSVVFSNAIEGIYTTKKRMTALMDYKASPLTHDEIEILGYRDALRYIKANYKVLDFNETTIKKIHSLLYSQYLTDKETNSYKKEDNLITEKNIEGSINKIIFEPVKAKDVNNHMKQLIIAYQSARDDYLIPNSLLIPCVILDFLSIHPFRDGNGRISRLLTLLLYLKEGIDIGKYISIEKMIDEYKWNYYDSLKRSQMYWHDNKSNYTPFILFNFQILYKCYKEMNNRLIYISKSKITKKSLVEEIILHSILPISKEEIHNLFPNISINTIAIALANLMKNKKIKKIGSYKDAKYFPNKN